MLPKVWATSVVLPLKVSTVVSAASHGSLPRPPGHPRRTVSHPFLGPGGPKSCAWRGVRGAGLSAQLGSGTKARGQLLVRSAVRPASRQLSALRSSQVESRLLRLFRLSSFLPSSRGAWSPLRGVPERGCLAYSSLRRAGACPWGLPPLPRPLLGVQAPV